MRKHRLNLLNCVSKHHLAILVQESWEQVPGRWRWGCHFGIQACQTTLRQVPALPVLSKGKEKVKIIVMVWNLCPSSEGFRMSRKQNWGFGIFKKFFARFFYGERNGSSAHGLVRAVAAYLLLSLNGLFILLYNVSINCMSEILYTGTVLPQPAHPGQVRGCCGGGHWRTSASPTQADSAGNSGSS